MADVSSPVRVAGRLTADLQGIFGGRLHAVVLYGAHARPHARPVRAAIQTVALVDGLTYADLSACAERTAAWQRAGLDVPLLLPRAEFERSLDTFPLEYGDIIDHHVVLLGEDPFVGLTIADEDRRRACEAQARGHAIHLREGFLAAGHDAAAVARLIGASVGPFASLMEAFTRVTAGPRGATPDMIATHAERIARLPASLIGRLLAIEEDGTLEPAEATQLFPPYLDLMHALVAFVDAWHTDDSARHPAAPVGHDA